MGGKRAPDSGRVVARWPRCPSVSQFLLSAFGFPLWLLLSAPRSGPMVRAVSVWGCSASAVTNAPSRSARRRRSWAAGISLDFSATGSEPNQRRVAHRVGADDLAARAAEPFLTVHRHPVARRIALAQDLVLPGQQGRFELARRDVAEQAKAGRLARRPIAALAVAPVAGEMAGGLMRDGEVGGEGG